MGLIVLSVRNGLESMAALDGLVLAVWEHGWHDTRREGGQAALPLSCSLLILLWSCWQSYSCKWGGWLQAQNHRQRVDWRHSWGTARNSQHIQLLCRLRFLGDPLTSGFLYFCTVLFQLQFLQSLWWWGQCLKCFILLQKRSKKSQRLSSFYYLFNILVTVYNSRHYDIFIHAWHWICSYLLLQLHLLFLPCFDGPLPSLTESFSAFMPHMCVYFNWESVHERKHV